MRQLKITHQITNRTIGIEKFFNEIASIEMLTNEQEVELAERSKNGDIEAQNKLVKANLRFVVSVAKQYQRGWIDLNDLIQAGNLGIIEAAKRYDPTRGFKFITYAVWWIRQKVAEEVSENRTIKLPNHRVTKQNKHYQEVEKARQKMHNGGEFEMVPVLELPHVSRYFEDPLSGKEEADCFGDFITDTEPGSEDRNLMRESLNDTFQEIITKILNPREAFVIRYRFGINTKTGREHTLDDIGEYLKLSRERCRQIETMAMRKLRKKKELLKQFAMEF